MEKLKKYSFILILLFLLLLKIVIVQVQPVKGEYTLEYDDLLMVKMTDSILSGNWLGEYNSKTLIKGVFTPLFMALLNIFNIPFLIGKEILYGIACITLILVLKKKIENKICLAIIYIIVLFNPVEYCSELSRAYRDGIYMSLILLLLACLFGIIFSRKDSLKRQLKYFISGGIIFSAIYLCREETIWLIPCIGFVLISCIISILIDKKINGKVKRILLYLIPIIEFLILINIVCFINYKYYGIYTLNQYWGKPFKSAYRCINKGKAGI